MAARDPTQARSGRARRAQPRPSWAAYAVRDPGQARPRAPRATQAKPGRTRRAQPKPDHEHCAQPRPTDPGSSLFLVSGFFFFFFFPLGSSLICYAGCYVFLPFIYWLLCFWIFFFFFWCILSCTRDLRVQVFLIFF